MKIQEKAREAEKKDFQHLTHTWMEEVVKIVYNTKKGKKEKKRKTKKKRKRKKKRKKKELSILSHSIKAYPRILSI